MYQKKYGTLYKSNKKNTIVIIEPFNIFDIFCSPYMDISKNGQNELQIGWIFANVMIVVFGIHIITIIITCITHA